MDDNDAGNVEALRGFVAERDVPCPACGYNLRGLTGRCCPECGLELRLGVQLGEPAMGALLTALAAGFGAVGASGAVLVGMFWLSVYYGDFAPAELWVMPLMTFMVAGPCTLALAGRPGRIWFRKRGVGARWGLAVVAWLGSVMAFMVFMAIALGL